MPATALLFALALQAADVPPAPAAPADAPPAQAGEPLPAAAPTEDYPLSAWCYGALSEYLEIYQRVKPDLRAIDKMFGSSEPGEKEPYHDDMVSARAELEVLAAAVSAAEKASDRPIADIGLASINKGRAIWRPAETKSSRELARAWLSWGLPDKCDSTARNLASRSALLGQALKYNAGQPAETPAAPPPEEPAPAPAAEPAPSPAEAAPTPVAEPAPAPAPTAPEPVAAPAPQPAAPPPATPVAAEAAPPPPAAAQAPVQVDPNGPIPDPNGPLPDATPH
jgi:hypothetical protein